MEADLLGGHHVQHVSQEDRDLAVLLRHPVASGGGDDGELSSGSRRRIGTVPGFGCASGFHSGSVKS
ncbi:hypothetical protein BV898_19555 [Hypsibius exemplaris]|uniref:Uncharacterized protein n=1 Tax=Hypsibius exemplaris TaxID=2072580 RepID=A0A9X6NLP5_HYPEX|nr:hypothetical protein BV898_19555 [Hypsibius exemplaris]